jgi:HAD superfamily hydrolase (TIGR01549 family)
MPPYRAILFDLDDTLYDFRAHWRSRLRLALAEVLARHPQLDAAALEEAALAAQVYIDQLPDFLRRHGVADEALIAAAHARYRDGWFECMVLPEATARALAALRPRYQLGLVTNGPVRTQRAKIERFGLAEVMDALVISEEVGVAKPDPAIFALALRWLGVAPAAALHVGDSPEFDLAGAAAAGIAAVWVNPSGTPLPPGIPPPLATVRSVAEVPALLGE